MKKYKIVVLHLLYLLILFPLCVHTADAQNQNIWVFGDRAGLNFNNGLISSFFFNNSVPAYTPSPNISYPYEAPQEASATICDENGQLLFYTEGSYVFDRHQNIMANGDNLTGLQPYVWVTTCNSPTQSTIQGAQIIPMPGEASKYYIFSLTSNQMGNNGGNLYYSVVDMTLNNGLGDIAAGQKGILLGTGFTGQMAAATNCNKDYWLMVVSHIYNQIHTYKVAITGVSTTPVISNYANVNTMASYTAGQGAIAVSKDNRKIAISAGFGQGTSIFDFNRENGNLYNQQYIDTVGLWHLCFSGDGSKLYSNATFNKVYQYNLNAGNTSAITSSKIEVASITAISDIKLAPNGKIYFSGSYSPTSSWNSLTAINLPNELGLACQPQTNALTLASGTQMLSGLPADLPIFYPDTLISRQSLSSCNFKYELKATDTSYSAYTWNDGFTGFKRDISTSGTYWVRYKNNCAYFVDTFHLTVNPTIVNRISKVICDGSEVDFGGKKLNTTGVYRDTIKTENGCDSVVVLDLIVLITRNLEIEQNLPNSICLGDSILLKANGAQFFQWIVNGAFDHQSNSITIRLDRLKNEILLVGINSFEGSDIICRDTIVTRVNANACCDVFIPSAFSPNNDGLNDQFYAIPYGNVQEYVLDVYNRWGQRVFSSFKLDRKWDGTFNGVPSDVGLYFYQLRSTCFDGTELNKKGEIMLLR